MTHNLGDTIIREEKETKEKEGFCFNVSEKGSFPVNVTEKSNALQKFAEQLINSFKQKTGNKKGTYKIENINLFGGASNYYNGKIKPDYDNDYVPIEKSNKKEEILKNTFTGDKKKNNQLAANRAKNVLKGLKSILGEKGSELGIIYDPEKEPKITSGTIFTNNNVDKKGSSINAGQIVSINAEICFTPDTKEEPKKEPNENPKEEPKKEPKEEPKKEPKEEPKNSICDANVKDDKGERGLEENDYVAWEKKYNFGDAKAVKITFEPLVIPDAFYVKYGTQEYFSGFIGKNYDERYTYGERVPTSDKRLSIPIMPKFIQGAFRKNPDAQMAGIPRNFIGELFLYEKNKNLSGRINNKITNGEIGNKSIGGKSIDVGDIIPSNSENVTKEIFNMTREGESKVIDRYINLLKSYNISDKSGEVVLKKEEGVNDVFVVVFSPLSKTKFKIKVQCQ